MHEQRHAFQVLPRGAGNGFPVLHLRGSHLHYRLGLRGVHTAGIAPLAQAEAFLRLAQGLTGVSQTPHNSPCITLDQVMDEVKHLRDTAASQASFGQRYERLGPVTDQGLSWSPHRLSPWLP